MGAALQGDHTHVSKSLLPCLLQQQFQREKGKTFSVPSNLGINKTTDCSWYIHPHKELSATIKMITTETHHVETFTMK